MNAGLKWLLAQQADDGGWHSATYGALRQGAAVTSLAFYAIANWEEPERFRPQLAKAWEFLRPGAEKKGCIANADGSLDYPEYSTALVLAALPKIGIKDERLQAAFLKYLYAAQLGKARGFEPTSPHFGGWDLLGNGALPGVTSGSNISLTSFVLEAIKGETDKRAETAREQALTWLARCQNHPGDGGFFFAPERESDANKAQWTDKAHKEPRSYGTTTADGLLALAACGVKPDDARFAAAVKWLAERPGLDHVPGFDDAPPELGWREGLSYYYFARRARCLAYLPGAQQPTRGVPLIERLAKLMKPDGFWQNDSARMREDDPLIATSLALIALAIGSAA